MPKWISYRITPELVSMDSSQELSMSEDPEIPYSKKMLKQFRKDKKILIPLKSEIHTEISDSVEASYSLNWIPVHENYVGKSQRSIEKAIRKWSRTCDEISVVTGIVPSKKRYPESIYTAILITRPDTLCFAMLTEVTDTLPWFILARHSTTVTQLEKQIGYELFPQLPKESAPLHKGEFMGGFILDQRSSGSKPQAGGFASGLDDIMKQINAEKKKKKSGYRISSLTGFRHAKQCRYYKAMNTKECSATEGTPCPSCGGEQQ